MNLCFAREIEDDICQLKSTAADVLNDIGSSGASIPDDLVSEICRFGAAELHCVAAVVGGIAAQESIKVRFVPKSLVS